MAQHVVVGRKQSQGIPHTHTRRHSRLSDDRNPPAASARPAQRRQSPRSIECAITSRKSQE
ncbi:hypothetical protein XMIN_2045 [Xanthomonas citri pv. mangiferaeindicae LMG 941]|nr:hypothetical protein XAR_1614 [Xanthomonas citri pv. glycines str. 8ra]CCG37066.1 hypothetical protein XMIN_2045 [Xanthomonas citri pv. mangiferaeindicae LMG 941]